MRNATIVILSKRLDLLEQAIGSVLATHATLDWCEFLVVDDGLGERPALADGLTYVDGEKPFVFAANVNIALRHIDPERDVILMNDDVRCVTTEGMSRLRQAAYQGARVGLVTPVTVPNGRQPVDATDDEDVSDTLTGSEHALSFAVAYLKRDLIQQAGFLDERFVGYGFDDTDYCFRAHLAGFEIGVMRGVVMVHGDDEGTSQTFRENKNHQGLFLANQERFIRKWCASWVGLTPEQIDRVLYFAKFNLHKSSLAARARAVSEPKKTAVRARKQGFLQ